MQTGLLSKNIMRRSMIGLIAACCVVAAVYALRLANQVEAGVTHDDAEYLVLAESFATGRPYRLVYHPATPLETTWPPGYPLFVLTLPYLLFGPNPDVLRLINVALALLAGYLGFRLLQHATTRLLALVVAGLFVINPHTVKWATLLMSDLPFTVAVFGFCLLYLHWKSHPTRPRVWYVLAVVTLTIAILIRYWGVAFLGAAVLDLFLERRWRAALALGLGTVLLVLPFPIFIALQPDGGSGSFFALNVISQDLGTRLASAGVSLITYGQTVPLLLVPLFGPTMSRVLEAVRLNGIILVVHAAIWLLVFLGARQVWQRQRFFVLIALSYLALMILLTEHRDLQPIVFDEPRYLVPIVLFLYLFVAEGVHFLGRRLPHAKQWGLAAVTVLLVIVLGRNVQQAVAERNFPVSNLTAGRAWVQANTAPDDVFMIVDPVSRYIHLRRPMLEFPSKAEKFWHELSQYQVRYLLIADSLNGIKESWSMEISLRPDHTVENVIRPILKQHLHCFSLVHFEAGTNTEIYRVNPNCLSESVVRSDTWTP